MTTTTFLLLAAALLGYGLVSARLERTIVTAPMVFVLFGLLAGPGVSGLVSIEINEGLIHLLAELTLVLVLFTDAARIDLRLLAKEHDLPVRLLAGGLPLSILLGTAGAMLLLDGFGLWEAALVAAILAPTDAALGQAVVSNEKVPVRIRQTLNVESGLNDGIALPVVLVLAAIAGAAGGAGVDAAGSHDTSATGWLMFAALQVTLGPLAGIAVGYFGGWAVSSASRAGWMSHAFQDLAAIGLSLLAFAGAEAIGGNGFIAAFCAGLTLGNTNRPVCACLWEFGEAEGQLLSLLVFAAFGAVLVPDAIAHAGLAVIVYAIVSLAGVRLIASAVSLIGSRMRFVTVLFLGWFGPRGLASILFALVVVEEGMVPAREEILVVVTMTVLLSVFAHGLTANPAARGYARRLKRLEAKDATACEAEMADVSEMPLRMKSSGAGATTR